MKVACLSDLHGYLPQVEKCDLVLISGDICPHFHYYHVGDNDDVLGQAEWLRTDFSNWLDSIDAKEKVIVFGNHDWVAEKRPDLLPKLNAHILFNEHVEVLGLKIFGSPFQLYFYNWAFNAPEENGEAFLAKIWSDIDSNTNIVVVHGPPYGYGDKTVTGERVGSKTLIKKLEEVKPMLTVCGHIHSDRNFWKYSDNSYIVNASVVNEKYKLVNLPFYFEIEEGRIERIP